ncbi:CPBP family intramembrane metalloprotease [uncultured Corynebacterium sp.]|uniref:CPBP family intramembrane metalloprotease n=1 Tax=uncultured Corynebacterium sp. TaxID=159447 RepID=UPI0025FA2490|nr:CPBP family intramembrane metalloprotease [uncultured Corynebacterium sp.]
MAEEKQLTVAELLARNAKERAAKGGSGDSEGGAPRRRRRRSLEDGGVSVAELTGSLSKVEATPAQAKHSNVDIDATAPVIPAPKREGDEETQAAAAQIAADKKAHAAAGAADKAEAEKAEADKRAAELAKAEEIKKAEFARKAEEAKKRAAEEKAAAEKQAAADAEAQRAQADEPKSPSSDDTTVIKKVDDAPAAESPEKNVDKNADKTADKSDDDTTVIPAVGTAAAAGAVGAAGAAAVKGGDKDAVGKDADADDAATGELEAVQADVAEDAAIAEDVDEDEEGAKLNPVSVVLLALIGIVLGAIVFKGFEILWGSISRPVVIVLAVAVTAIMAGVVHALRTERDRASMLLAAIVGLLLTFGPLLLV